MDSPASAPVTAVHYADPWCVWTWGLQPALRRVQSIYGEGLHVEYRIAGAIEYFEEWRRKMKLEGPALVDWLKKSMVETGNPVDPECLTKGGFSSSFGACLAATAAQRLDPARAPHYARRLMEYLQVRGLAADARVLTQAARDVGIDGGRLQRTWGEHAVRTAFDAVRTEMRTSRRTFRQVEYRGASGTIVLVDGEFRAAPHEAAIQQVAPDLPRRPPGPMVDYFQADGNLVSQREVAEVFGLSDTQAEEELSKLWKQGAVERWTYGGAPFWTAVRRRARESTP